MKRCKTLLASLSLILTSLFTQAQNWKTYPYAIPGSRVAFPKDEGVHSKEPIEWWYTVGHLMGETTGTHYSFMLTYFHYPYMGFGGFRILNLSNDNTGTFYGETRPVNYTTLTADSLNIAAAVYNQGTETWSNKKGGNGKAIPFEYSLAASNRSGSINLDYVSTKAPLILADSGFFYQGAASYTYYYSQTGNDVTGTITLPGVSEKVKGTAWIDRQYGSFNPVSGEKYEWFNMQLSNGMDLNIFNIFTNDNRTPNTINYKTLAVYVDSTSQYTTADFKLERLAFEYTTDSVQCYSRKWRLTSSKNNIDLTFEAPYNGYEVTLPFRFYEGPTNIAGTVNGKPVTGKGFAELLHSYQKPVVDLSALPLPSATTVEWKLKNPDDGRAIKYDLAYRTGNQQTFSPIASGLTDSMYFWNNVPATKYWLKLTAYSLDTTLVSTKVIEITPMVTGLSSVANKSNQSFYAYSHNGTVHIQSNHSFSKAEIVICDITGKQYAPKVSTQSELIQIDMNGLTSGLYVIKVQIDGEMRVIKWIVE